jgi:succinoglycan biosynthesis protein ExoO
VPRFTILTATKGRPGVLREALLSALAQECRDFEHVVVDDGSEDDGAARVVKELGDPRIRLVRLDRSRGPAGARNARASRRRAGNFARCSTTTT